VQRYYAVYDVHNSTHRVVASKNDRFIVVIDTAIVDLVIAVRQRRRRKKGKSERNEERGERERKTNKK
jgi:hypothetical protein